MKTGKIPGVTPAPTVLPSEQDVVEVLRGVVDPELGSDIVDLGMVRDVDVAPDGRVSVGVALTISGCPLRTQIREDVESKVRGLPGVQVLDLDELERECPLDVTARRAEIERAEALATEEAERIADWLRVRAVGPAIVELRGYAEEVRVAEIRRSSTRLKGLTPEQGAAIEALTAGIVNKLLHGPTIALRNAAARPGGLRRSQSRIVRVLRPDRGRAA